MVDRYGDKVGTLKEIYLDEDERPNWGSIATGLFGTRETLAPLTAAVLEGDALEVTHYGERVTVAADSPVSLEIPPAPMLPRPKQPPGREPARRYRPADGSHRNPGA